MNTQRARNFAMMTAALGALGAGFLLAGCKGNPTSAAGPEKHVGPPPKVDATGVLVDPTLADPTTDIAWSNAKWYSLVAPSDTARTTPPVKAAMMYDADTFYVAFVSETVPPPPSPVTQDVVSIYLDTSTSHDGTETVQITTDAEGHASCSWIRSSIGAHPREDGSPEWAHSTQINPDITIKDLKAQSTRTMRQGHEVWTAVLAIPLKNVKQMPVPLRATASAGLTWHVNLLRMITMADTGAGVQRLQSNLSPVYVGAQSVSPYRMAEVKLAPTGVSSNH